MKAEGPQDDLGAQIAALDLGLFIASTASTIAALSFTKLDRGELEQTKLGIEALTVLVPLLEGDQRRDLASALANLQVGYADAVRKAGAP